MSFGVYFYDRVVTQNLMYTLIYVGVEAKRTFVLKQSRIPARQEERSVTTVAFAARAGLIPPMDTVRTYCK